MSSRGSRIWGSSPKKCGLASPSPASALVFARWNPARGLFALFLFGPTRKAIPTSTSESIHPFWSQDEKEAFQLYLQKFGECRDGSNPGRSLRCWRRGRRWDVRNGALRRLRGGFWRVFAQAGGLQKGFAAQPWSVSSDSLMI